MENQKVKSLFEKFIGWSRGGFRVDSRSVFQNYGLFIFRLFLKKWTRKLKNGLLVAQKFNIKLLYRQTQTIERIVQY